jgi:hypothetical protein
MASLRLSVPGKSFLAGEYLALKEGPCLIFNSNPRFELLARPGTGQFKGLHPDSPAGKLIHAQSEYFQNLDLEFIDPHQGRGGWGASTAQFLAAFVLNEWRESCELETLKSLSVSRLLDSYWKYSWNGQGTRPSGADLVAQYKGSLTLFEKRSGLMSVYQWPFADIDVAFIATGQKVATHEHLQSLGNFDESGLQAAMVILQKSLQTGDSVLFVEGLRNAGRALQELGFVADATQRLITSLQAVAGVLAVKGCGALGADVVLAVFEKKERLTLEAALHRLGLEVTAFSENLSRGFQIEVRNP